MRRTSIAALGLLSGVLLVATADCGKVNEGVNVNNLHVTVLVPKTVITSASGIGVVYVGIYSGTDSRLGYVSPIVAPVANPALQDAFPFGGASIGDFETRDYRLMCKTVTNQDVIDAGGNWQLDVDVLQFPFYKGEVVWAWADRPKPPAAPLNEGAYSSCNTQDGYQAPVAIPLELTAVSPSGPNFIVSFAPTSFTIGGNDLFLSPNLDILDAHGHYWNLAPNSLDEVNDTMTLVPSVGVSLTPAIEGSASPRLENNDDFEYYGTQFHDILNFPAKYVEAGDAVSSTPPVLDTLHPVTVTIDTVVP